MRGRPFPALIVAALLMTFVSSYGDPGPSRFPSSDENPRAGTPNDPGYDCAEPDDEDTSRVCSSVWDEQNYLFGFAPASTSGTALYHDPTHLASGEASQRSGVSADRAWKLTIGQPSVTIAIIDTGIRWDRSELRAKIHLNSAELPIPEPSGGPAAASYDANGDGAFNVDDYATDPRVDLNGGTHGVADVVDGEDLIAVFSDGTDADGNGYVDDIAGWDFFDDDNNPFDASSYSSAHNHGSGRADDAAAETNNGAGDAGVCPRCQIMPLRAWDTFVVPGDNYAMATLYLADNGASVQEVALGVLQNSPFSQAATQYAFHKGVALMQVSSDLNTSDHNYPTNYNNTIFVAGTVADTYGLGEDAGALAPTLKRFGLGAQAPVATWFRNSNITQFGGHAAIVMNADTGSFATGQAAGAAGLIKSRGLELTDAIGGPLTSNEVKQLLTMTAEDVVPENTLGLGIPDPSQPGWDQHFGYGRVDLGAAVARVAPNQIPPEAGIESPPWFAPLDPVVTPSLPIAGFANARRAGSFTYELQYAPGLEPPDDSFTTFATGAGSGETSGTLGVLPLADVAAQLPGASEGVPPSDPYQYAFTVRLRVHDDLGNKGEDRKTLFAFHDPTLRWSKFIDAGGESSLRMADLYEDGKQEIVAGTSAGTLHVWDANGHDDARFNGGQPFTAPVTPMIAHHLGAPAFTSGAVAPGRGGFTSPAIGDVDGDGGPDIVAANGDAVYAIHADGTPLAGFPVHIDPLFSPPELRTNENHLKTGFFASPALADLDEDGVLDVVIAGLDQRVYAWSGRGVLLNGWPVFAQDPAATEPSGAEIINTPAIADIDGDGHLDVVLPTNEYYQASAPAPNFDGILDALRKGVVDTASGLAGLVSSRVYAIQHDGTAHGAGTGGPSGATLAPNAFLPGWPVSLNGVADVLPFIGPGFDPVAVDVNGDGVPEIVIGAPLGNMVVFGGDGRPKFSLRDVAGVGTNVNPGEILNLFEYPAVGDLTGAGTVGIFKGGIPAEGLVNLVAPGQNLPFTHVVQGWEARTGQTLPGWPRATDDWQLLSSPAIANVAGGTEREVLVGTGLYLLHAYGPTGVESSGFPKFTGGWLYGVSAVGDLDGDGALEIANWTREGNVFVWNTRAPACGGVEWGGFRHDTTNTGVYSPAPPCSTSPPG